MARRVQTDVGYGDQDGTGYNGLDEDEEATNYNIDDLNDDPYGEEEDNDEEACEAPAAGD